MFVNNQQSSYSTMNQEILLLYLTPKVDLSFGPFKPTSVFKHLWKVSKLMLFPLQLSIANGRNGRNGDHAHLAAPHKRRQGSEGRGYLPLATARNVTEKILRRRRAPGRWNWRQNVLCFNHNWISLAPWKNSWTSPVLGRLSSLKNSTNWNLSTEERM